jgi:hypothetical protein
MRSYLVFVRPLILGLILLLGGVAASAGLAQNEQPAAQPSDGGWPRQFTVDQNTLTVYQPQVESWDQALLKARAAVSVQKVGAASPEYGTIEFTARTLVDKEAGLVTFTDVQIAEGVFPSAADKGAAYLNSLRQQFVAHPTQIALGRLEASLAIAAASQKPLGQDISNDPPRIIYSDKPALLVLIDGPPALRQFGSSGLMRVINTRALIALDKSSGKYYMRALGGWMRADAAEGPWAYEPNPPASLTQALTDAGQEQGIDLMDASQGSTLTAAQVAAYVSTTPAELVQTDGQPDYLPIPGTQILYADDTESQLFLYLPEQKVYLLVSGRWFRSSSLEHGPWEYVDQSKLPPDFAKIPEEHPSGGALASVANTPQAQEAAISNTIPQTAEVKVDGPNLNVAYDGPPQFQPIEGTQLTCAVNTLTPVIQVSPTAYYACDNAVWFTAGAAIGPWHVALEVPAAVYTIPVRHRLHYVTYVRIYRHTPETIIVGYTPGYYGTILAPSGCVVYGTGYHYVPYCGAFWVPAPISYGWGASFSCGYRTGFAFGFTAGWEVGTWCRPFWGGFGWNNVHVNHFTHVSFNHYNSFRHWDAAAVVRHERAPVERPRERVVGVPSPARAMPNNVVAGHDGRVYRLSGAGAVERHDSGQWKPVSNDRADHDRVQAVHREVQARGHGEERSRTIGPETPRATPSGGFHGGTGGGFQRAGPVPGKPAPAGPGRDDHKH